MSKNLNNLVYKAVIQRKIVDLLLNNHQKTLVKSISPKLTGITVTRKNKIKNNLKK